jgi:hypothetical protein
VLRIIWKVIFPFGTRKTTWLFFTILVIWPIGYSFANKYVWVPITAALSNFKSIGSSIHGVYAFLGIVDGSDQTLFGLLQDVGTFFKSSILQGQPQSPVTTYKRLVNEVKNQLRSVNGGLSKFG